MKFVQASLATAFFLLLLVGIYFVHVRWLPVNVVFYSAMVDALLATVLAGSVLLLARRFRLFTGFEKCLLLAIWLLTGYALAISVPTVIDRSLSFYILEKLQQRGGGIRQDRFDVVFTQEYMKEHRLIDVRLTEQLESGTIQIRNGCVVLTDKGQRIARFGRAFRQHWLPKQRLLMGEYSADLTDPFREETAVPDYRCPGSVAP